ncbi:MAG: DUF4105 domain-containing protein [Bdellovibrionales bacterium]|nr:DUF4105 domain-containing protein [Bdellovibrionales bacterium]
MMMVLLVLLTTINGFTDVTTYDSACAVSNDKFEAPLRFNTDSSKFSKQCSFTEKFRAAHINIDTETEIEFANYLHNNNYYTLTIPKNIEVEAAFFQIEKFPVISGIIAAHTQLRFTFKKENKIKARSQTDESSTTKIEDLIISFEASYPKGNSYNFAIGAFDNYALVGRLTSGKQAQDESPGRNVEQYKLKLTKAELSELLFKAIHRSDYLQQKYFYNTLRPNCTTEVFDLLDSLPSTNGKYDPFLTVISNDPIAAPSVAALKERNILERRWSNLNDELTTGTTEMATTDEDQSEKLLADIDNRPYSLVLVSPSDIGQSDQEIKAIQKAKQLVYESMPAIMQSLGSAMITTTDKQDMLLSVLNQYMAELRKGLIELKPYLNGVDTNVSLYFVPWKTDLGVKTNFKTLGVNARLPFEIFEVDANAKKTLTEALYFVNDGTRLVQDLTYNDPTKAMFFMGSAITIHLNKNPSITIQALAGLNPQTLPQEVSNEQVNITSLVIPKVDKRAERPVFLLSLRQDLESPKPDTIVEFGAEGGISAQPSRYGEFQIFTSMVNCELQKKSAPLFVGTLAEAATGNRAVDILLKGKGVSFSIRSVQLELKTGSVSAMDILVATWPISCLSNGGVNQQFAENVNEVLKEKFSAENKDSGLIQLLMDKILQ